MKSAFLSASLALAALAFAASTLQGAQNPHQPVAPEAVQLDDTAQPPSTQVPNIDAITALASAGNPVAEEQPRLLLRLR